MKNSPTRFRFLTKKNTANLANLSHDQQYTREIESKGLRNEFDVWNLENVVHLPSVANVLLSSLLVRNAFDMCTKNVMMTYLSLPDTNTQLFLFQPI